MGVDYSRTRLQQTLKELMLRWEKAREDWDDQVSQDFQETYLDLLEPKVKATVDAMEEMAEILGKLRRDCG